MGGLVARVELRVGHLAAVRPDVGGRRPAVVAEGARPALCASAQPAPVGRKTARVSVRVGCVERPQRATHSSLQLPWPLHGASSVAVQPLPPSSPPPLSPPLLLLLLLPILLLILLPMLLMPPPPPRPPSFFAAPPSLPPNPPNRSRARLPKVEPDLSPAPSRPAPSPSPICPINPLSTLQAAGERASQRLRRPSASSGTQRTSQRLVRAEHRRHRALPAGLTPPVEPRGPRGPRRPGPAWRGPSSIGFGPPSWNLPLCSLCRP